MDLVESGIGIEGWQREYKLEPTFDFRPLVRQKQGKMSAGWVGRRQLHDYMFKYDRIASPFITPAGNPTLYAVAFRLRAIRGRSLVLFTACAHSLANVLAARSFTPEGPHLVSVPLALICPAEWEVDASLMLRHIPTS